MKNPDNLTNLELKLLDLLKKATDALYNAGEDQISNNIHNEVEKAVRMRNYLKERSFSE